MGPRKQDLCVSGSGCYACERIRLFARITRFSGSTEIECARTELPTAGAWAFTTAFAGATWEAAAGARPAGDRPDAVDGEVTFTVTAGAAREVAVALEWEVGAWSPEVFVLIPAAAYNGNRYPCRPYRYPPMVHESGDVGPDAPILVTDVPRLAHDGGPSRIQLSSGDAATPCIAFHDPRAGQAAILLTDQGVLRDSAVVNHGLTVEERPDRTHAILRVESPCVRRQTLYTMVSTATPSWDRGADLVPGARVTIRYRLFVFPAPTVQSLYDRFAVVRGDLAGSTAPVNEYPLSAAARLVEEKHARENWLEDGYYRVGTHDAAAKSRYQDWQAGWVGGGMIPFPLIVAGSPESRERAVANLEWMFACAQRPSGLFHAGQHAGVAYGDGFDTPGTERWYMTRKQADALYFVVKSFIALARRDAVWRLPAHWEAGTRRLADRLLDTFRRFGQLGQYLDCESGDVVVGGSTAAAMAPGALALAGEYLGEARYLDTARTLAGVLEQDLRAGVMTGGPGEILKCADSESAFALLESFVVLYEVTGEPRWLERAEAAAAHCLTWCVSYDYALPGESPLGRIGARTAGSVWANVQNKHSAPGICTLSGDSLFKLFRATGNRRWLDSIQATGHAITQYVSRADRPLGDPAVMRPGYICERVNTSDWEGPAGVGGNLFGSCWPEVSLLLTAAELPGIYLQPDTGLLCIIDHVEAEPVFSGNEVVSLECRNPTAFDAEVRLFVERSTDAGRVLGQAAALDWETLAIPAGERRTVRVG